MSEAPAQRRAWMLFATGAGLFAAACAALAGEDAIPGMVAVYLTPLFGLPYLAVAGRRRGAWPLFLYFLILLPAFHYLAFMAAVKALGSILDGSPFVAGLAGGFVGSALSLLVLAPLSRRGRRGAKLLSGVILLTLIGGAGAWLITPMARWAGEYSGVLTLYLPWQVAFGFFLSRLLAKAPSTSS
jgi:hypothetical protein